METVAHEWHIPPQKALLRITVVNSADDICWTFWNACNGDVASCWNDSDRSIEVNINDTIQQVPYDLPISFP